MSRTDSIVVVKAVAPHDKEACLAIRREVFVEEQNVPLARDLDGLDDSALHFLALHNDAPVGTARVRFKDNGITAKIERLAVRKPGRGHGVAKQIMQSIEADPDVSRAAKFILEAQTYVISFYERLGYEATGDEFMDAGIPHRFMSKANPHAACSSAARAV